MTTSMRLLGGISILCLTVLGMLYVFGVVTADFISSNIGRLVLGVLVLAVAIVAVKMLSGGGSGSDTEPPPTL